MQSTQSWKRFVLLGAVLAILTSLPGVAEAGCLYGCWFHPCVHQRTTVTTSGVSTPLIGTSTSALVPNVGTAAIQYQTAAVSPLTTMTTASVPVTYYTSGLTWVPATTASATPALLPNPTATTTASIFRPASTSPASATAASTITEYNQFLQRESGLSPAGVFLPASDTAGMSQNFPNLVGRMGLDRLHSIGRYLQTKVNDPSFRKKAFDLFGSVLGTAFPQYAPVLNEVEGFLGQLNPNPATNGGGGTGTTPSVNTPLGNLPVNAQGELRVHVTLDNGSTTSPPQKPEEQPPKPVGDAGPAPAPSPSPSPNTLDTIEAVAKALGATVTRTSSGVSIKKADGTVINYGPDGLPRP